MTLYLNLKEYAQNLVLIIENLEVTNRMGFHFQSSEVHTTMVNGQQQTKRQNVNVTNGKGTKTLVVSDNSGTKKSTKKLSKKEIKNIQNRKFMPNLFSDCKKCLRPMNKTRKNRRN